MSVFVTSVFAATVAPTPAAAEVVVTECAAGTSTEDLNRLFAGQVADVVGFDTPRVYPVPDGRWLWMLQDVYTAPAGVIGSSLRAPVVFAHNTAMVQEGACFTSIHPDTPTPSRCGDPDRSYVGGALSTTCYRWFWAMGGGMGADDRLNVFFVEMVNDLGTGASPGARPVAVWLARIDASTFDVLSFQPAPAPQGDIVYGAAVESDESFTYLFGRSHDEHNRPDPTSPSPAKMFVARVPLGRFDLVPSYWDGSDWVADRSAAVPISDTADDRANAMWPRRMGDTWVTVVKEDEWWTADMRLDVAEAPQGPWTTVRRFTLPTRTLDGRTNTYGAHLLPWRSSSGNLVVSLSNNAWVFNPVAVDRPWIYRPTFFEVEAPEQLVAPAPPAVLSPPLGFLPSTAPSRVLDTRQTARLVADEVLRVELDGLVHDDAHAVAMNLTAVAPSARGFVTAWPCDRPQPPTANLNVVGTVTRGAHVVAALAGDRSICIYTKVATHLVIDITGSYAEPTTAGSLGFHPAEATRLYDSREDGGAWEPGEDRPIGVPGDADAVAINIAVTEATTAGFVTVHRCDQPVPLVASLNMPAGRTVANLVQTASAGGELCVYSHVRAHIVVDLVGTYDDAPDGLHFQPIEPTRFSDTRTGQGTVIGRVAQDAWTYGILRANAPVAMSNLPDEARAVFATLAIVAPEADGWAVIGPCQEPAQLTPYTTSTLNARAGSTASNATIVATRAQSGHDVCTFATSPADHVVDVVGWFV